MIILCRRRLNNKVRLVYLVYLVHVLVYVYCTIQKFFLQFLMAHELVDTVEIQSVGAVF